MKKDPSGCRRGWRELSFGAFGYGQRLCGADGVIAFEDAATGHLADDGPMAAGVNQDIVGESCMIRSDIVGVKKAKG